MRTEDLIVDLVRTAGPVTLAPPLGKRIAVAVASVFGCAAGLVLVIGARGDVFSALGRSDYAASLIVLMVAAALAAASAVRLSVPGATRSPWPVRLAVLAVAAWPIVWFLTRSEAASAAPVRLVHWACMAEIAVLSVIVGVVLVVMIRRAAPLQIGLTAILVMMSAVTVGAIAAQIICPIDAAAHQLVSHVLPAFGIGIIGAMLVGRRIERSSVIGHR